MIDKKDIKERWNRALDHECKSNSYPILRASLKVPKKLQNIKLQHNSLWGNPDKEYAKVTEVDAEFHIGNGDISRLEVYIQLFAHHNLPWEIYTDSGFEKNLSKVLSEIFKSKIKIVFTEQGMQEDKIASIENADNGLFLADWILSKNGYKRSRVKCQKEKPLLKSLVKKNAK
jgi:hypothetical protein